MMSRLRENPKKISKNFPFTQFKKKSFSGFFQDKWLIFRHGSNGIFCLYEPINTLEALFGDFGPETEFSILTEMINFQVFFENCVDGKFLRIFLGFSRGLLFKARRLSYSLFNSVVWEPQKKMSLKKKIVIVNFEIYRVTRNKIIHFFKIDFSTLKDTTFYYFSLFEKLVCISATKKITSYL